MIRVVDMADRKARQRAWSFYGFAAVIVVLLLATMHGSGAPALRGAWLGLTLGAALSLSPLLVRLKIRFKPNAAVARLLDDESTQEHRQMANMAGWWAALAAALALDLVAEAGGAISAANVARVIATVAVGAALVSFATLELRAARG